MQITCMVCIGLMDTNHLSLLTATVFTNSEGPAVRGAEGRFDWSVCE